MTSVKNPALRLDELAYRPSVFLAAAGVWLAFSPLIADDRSSYPWGIDVLAGVAIVALATIRLLVPKGTAALSVLAAAIGGWLVAAPFVLGFAGQSDAAWNHKIVGVIVIFLAAISAFAGDGRSGRR